MIESTAWRTLAPRASAMTAPESSRASSAISYILGATVVAGASGYVIQALVPAFTSRAEYVAFSVYWSAVYLAVAGVAGVQQEVTRAARPGRPTRSAAPTLVRFAVAAAGLFTALILLSGLLWATPAFGARAWELMPALALAVAAYTLVAVLSGIFYGSHEWGAVAGLTIADALFRLLGVCLVILLGGSVVSLGWAVAAPFAAAVALLWWLRGRRAVREVDLDVSLHRLARNSLSTVGAALATGVMISGLPLVLGLTSRGVGETTLASLILVITLTRAPLVIPLMALQSYLVVTYRDAPQRALRRTVVWSGLLIFVTAGLALVGTIAGPWVIHLLYGERYSLEPVVYAAVILSAGLTALLCLTGPAALARGKHGRYVAGWTVSAGALVASLGLFGGGQVSGVVIPLMAAPVLGAMVHLTALVGRPYQHEIGTKQPS